MTLWWQRLSLFVAVSITGGSPEPSYAFVSIVPSPTPSRIISSPPIASAKAEANKARASRTAPWALGRYAAAIGPLLATRQYQASKNNVNKNKGKTKSTNKARGNGGGGASLSYGRKSKTAQSGDGNSSRNSSKNGGNENPRTNRVKDSNANAVFGAATAFDASPGPRARSGSPTRPPWQIVSKKDMQKNLKAEKERRKIAQAGGGADEASGAQPLAFAEQGLTLSNAFLHPADKAMIAWKRFSPSGLLHQQLGIRFVGAHLDDKRMPPRLGVPEVAFLGRSNVGKSSLLNKLVGSGAARVGKTPGATASVNLYGIYDQKDKPVLGLVDLPGFGYARLSKNDKESVQLAAENYLGKRKELTLAILLMDIRRVPSDDDRAVLAALYDMGLPIVVVATKLDKLSASKAKVEAALAVIRDGLGLPEKQPLCVSSVTGDGIRDLWAIILEACETGVEEYREKLIGEKVESDEIEDQELQEEEDDEKEFIYDQGFDWIHGTDNIMYEGDDVYGYDYKEEYSDDDDQDGVKSGSDVPPQKETIKFLRKKVRSMQRKKQV